MIDAMTVLKQYQHLISLAHLQIGFTIVIGILLVVSMSINQRVFNLLKKQRDLIKEITEAQEERLKISTERIDILESIVGLRKPPPPPPPTVVM